MNRMTVVYHMATPKSDGRIAVTRVGKVCRDGVVVSTMTHSVTLTPDEARSMARAMRARDGYFFKEDVVDSVEVWCEPYETSWIAWKREGGEDVCEDICRHASGGDGWSWEFARELEDAAYEAEAGEKVRVDDSRFNI
jgi:hypothetical protein